MTLNAGKSIREIFSLNRVVNESGQRNGPPLPVLEKSEIFQPQRVRFLLFCPYQVFTCGRTDVRRIEDDAMLKNLPRRKRRSCEERVKIYRPFAHGIVDGHHTKIERTGVFFNLPLCIKKSS
ncbi:hypothetical protein TNIN_293851 [Trichonephila inaurata madagascariensis]|uniref:Uncharacterized protein n=1 Tax=Trichonephila inaurata madagascariensis TaxID=2747483 RepID=A0A8X6XHP7_9ARAC|nr:hypothetical protein TNIN_293851 [Trichonephila inaurata madagascariensis]